MEDHTTNNVSIRAREVSNMIGMDFISFLILLIISVVASAILHYGLKFYVTPGFESFCFKVVVGWVGAWLGSPVFGYWPHKFPFLHYQNIWFIPAILGSLAVLALAVDFDKRARHAMERGKL
jgi:uncharacterized membrane protein YeaQ/YmgE (transglycosylase-associated protein family)